MVSTVAVSVFSTIIILYGIRKLRERKWGWCRNQIKLDNKVVVVTGANSGIGYEIAKDLANRNALVILACRNLGSAKLAISRMETDVGRQLNLIAMELNLASLKSIQKFAEEVQMQFPEIHILINNAGVSYPKNQTHKTEDGFEIHFGVNHLGHFYLTNLLLDTLKKSTPSRIVIISSALHERGTINLNNFETVDSKNLYADSKLANVYFCKELAKRVKTKELNVYAVCPGWVYTSLFRHSIRWYHYILIAPIAFFFMRTPKQGAQTPIYCATEPSLAKESGLLYRNCGHYETKKMLNDEVSSKLWVESERLIKEKNIVY